MPATVIVGLQWGDEGKGKATDFLAPEVSVVVRYQGGDNAGHTVVLGEEVFKLHLVPSGVLSDHIVPVIGPGVVVNPATLIAELDGLAARGIDVSRVRVSHAAHVIMPYHVALDRVREGGLGRAAVGTTQRGIGPAYADRALRTGVRMEDLLDAGALRRKLERVVPEKNALLAHLGDTGQAYLVAALTETALAWGVRLRDHVADTTTLVQDALRTGQHVLLEGAQGTLLDLDHGSYPFVTSSSPVAGGACTGGGLGPLQVTEVIGVMKAYTTRVGAGPYPTELTDEIGERIASRGHEFGTTTGRRRRVGWFDAVPIRYAVDVNSASSIILNKLDILAGLPEILVCVAYEIGGRRVERWPASAEEVARAEPVYERFPGWPEEIHEARTFGDLPPNARAYVDALEQIAGVPITVVSVGPERTQTVVRASRPGAGPGARPGGARAPAR
jgi:adenylosuccinate synthase